MKYIRNINFVFEFRLNVNSNYSEYCTLLKDPVDFMINSGKWLLVYCTENFTGTYRLFNVIITNGRVG